MPPAAAVHVKAGDLVSVKVKLKDYETAKGPLQKEFSHIQISIVDASGAVVTSALAPVAK